MNYVVHPPPHPGGAGSVNWMFRSTSSISPLPFASLTQMIPSNKIPFVVLPRSVASSTKIVWVLDHAPPRLKKSVVSETMYKGICPSIKQMPPCASASHGVPRSAPRGISWCPAGAPSRSQANS